MRVLVTGNLGYIGPVVTRHLKAAGHYVVGLDTGWFLPNLASLPEWPDEQYFGDIRDEDGRGMDAIVHLAGLSNDPMGNLDPALTHAINFEGTCNLLARWDSRHVIVSSCSVYGTADMATERTEPHPISQYAVSKAAVDDFARVMMLNRVSLRLGTVYGWSPGHRLDLVVNRMTYDATHGLGITVNGNAARPLTHIEDVARVIVFMLDRGETGVYNVVGENWRMRDLADLISQANRATRVIEKPAAADLRDYAASGDKLLGLGWQPASGVADVLPDLIPRTAALGTPSRYVRLDALRNLIASGYLDSDLRTERIAA